MQELVQRFCENCVALSAKLNDSAQWTKRVDEEIAVDSELFTVTLLESVKDKALARVSILAYKADLIPM